MFVDVVASTERLATMGDRPWLSLLDRLVGGIRQEVERYGGAVVKSTGDGLLATFDGAATAVSSALASVNVADVHGIDVRCGLHTGEVERVAGDIGGLAVHIAQRVCTCAAPGTVLVSRTTADVVAGSGLHLAPGIHVPLRGVPGEWELFAAGTHR
jgi:class 3 adenylate cyclase